MQEPRNKLPPFLLDLLKCEGFSTVFYVPKRRDRAEDLNEEWDERFGATIFLGFDLSIETAVSFVEKSLGKFVSRLCCLFGLKGKEAMRVLTERQVRLNPAELEELFTVWTQSHFNEFACRLWHFGISCEDLAPHQLAALFSIQLCEGLESVTFQGALSLMRQAKLQALFKFLLGSLQWAPLKLRRCHEIFFCFGQLARLTLPLNEILPKLSRLREELDQGATKTQSAPGLRTPMTHTRLIRCSSGSWSRPLAYNAEQKEVRKGQERPNPTKPTEVVAAHEEIKWVLAPEEHEVSDSDCRSLSECADGVRSRWKHLKNVSGQLELPKKPLRPSPGNPLKWRAQLNSKPTQTATDIAADSLSVPKGNQGLSTQPGGVSFDTGTSLGGTVGGLLLQAHEMKPTQFVVETGKRMAVSTAISYGAPSIAYISGKAAASASNAVIRHVASGVGNAAGKIAPLVGPSLAAALLTKDVVSIARSKCLHRGEKWLAVGKSMLDVGVGVGAGIGGMVAGAKLGGLVGVTGGPIGFCIGFAGGLVGGVAGSLVSRFWNNSMTVNCDAIVKGVFQQQFKNPQCSFSVKWNNMPRATKSFIVSMFEGDEIVWQVQNVPCTERGLCVQSRDKGNVTCPYLGIMESNASILLQLWALNELIPESSSEDTEYVRTHCLSYAELSAKAE